MPSDINIDIDPNTLPHFGYVYFLVNAADALREPEPAEAGSHVKIGFSEVPIRRMKSIAIPIDWHKSFFIRYAAADKAYAVEQRLHRMVAGSRDIDFLKPPPSRTKTTHRTREAMAGYKEWFTIDAKDKALAIVESDDFIKLFGAGTRIPALDIIPRDQAPQDAEEVGKHANYKKARQLMATLAAMGARKIVSIGASPSGDNYFWHVISPHRPTLEQGTEIQLPFTDGRQIPLFGPVIEIGKGSYAAEIMVARPNNLERSREIGSMRKLAGEAMNLPLFPGIKPAEAKRITQSIGVAGVEVKPDFTIGSRMLRRKTIQQDGQPLLFDHDKMAATRPEPSPAGSGNKPQP